MSATGEICTIFLGFEYFAKSYLENFHQENLSGNRFKAIKSHCHKIICSYDILRFTLRLLLNKMK